MLTEFIFMLQAGGIASLQLNSCAFTSNNARQTNQYYRYSTISLVIGPRKSTSTQSKST
ncbi:hypothetical protein PF005_g29782 [Phytophthora fragariae]|uniref:Uncharacterized protein n=1 Tax=Phytophthora fragariae TaxID=53985 RepID=A0A6A3VGB7_9STRA|nr:hypothetical protein PF003_g1432 [Phytophthora fragariae]KAE8963851.1 hypothetical protein PF011_g28884 [Phytophthora fragariae]KAE9062326.1 hypothetical protein PF010_g29450 [Phytophthora fragariae]KAE9064020.1 hypothetical protein PF007_g29340 [Phytophthora fragariae]KAE9069666.1 hypothetical protein PF006_g29524 [Phytophthora fragariae]